MDPNSTHQLWSRWTTLVTVPFHRQHTRPEFLEDVKRTTATVYRHLFGSATEMRIAYEVLRRHSRLTVDCRTEGAPAPDVAYRQSQMQVIAGFFAKSLRHYGQVTVHVDVKIEAGDVGDGKPPAQLILGPPLLLMPRTALIGSR